MAATTAPRVGSPPVKANQNQPAAVLSLTVPESARPGLYSILAFRDGRFSISSGSLEVL